MVKKNTLIMPEGWHWDMREKTGYIILAGWGGDGKI